MGGAVVVGAAALMAVRAGGRTVLWAAVSNPPRWASGLFRLDEEGRARLQFANAGSIMQVPRQGSEAGWKLLVAGVNNAYSRAFAAEIPAEGPAAFSPPSGNDLYHFADGPKGDIRHRAAECPEMTGRQAMRRWTAAEGWTEMAVPVAGPHPALMRRRGVE